MSSASSSSSRRKLHAPSPSGELNVIAANLASFRDLSAVLDPEKTSPLLVKSLNLHGNRLKKICISEISNLFPNLTQLTLSSNEIARISTDNDDRDEPRVFPHLRSLDLSCNSLSPSLTGLNGLQNLERLILPYNGLRTLQPLWELWGPGCRIKELDVRDNLIEELSEVAALRGLVRLANLRFMPNPIREADSDDGHGENSEDYFGDFDGNYGDVQMRSSNENLLSTNIVRYRLAVLQQVATLTSLDGIPVSVSERRSATKAKLILGPVTRAANTEPSSRVRTKSTGNLDGETPATLSKLDHEVRLENLERRMMGGPTLGTPRSEAHTVLHSMQSVPPGIPPSCDCAAKTAKLTADLVKIAAEFRKMEVRSGQLEAQRQEAERKHEDAERKLEDGVKLFADERRTLIEREMDAKRDFENLQRELDAALEQRGKAESSFFYSK